MSEQIYIPYLLTKFSIDIFFSSSGGGALPLFCSKKIKLISALYGTHHLFAEHKIGSFRIIFRKFISKKSFNVASAIIVNSNSCKNTLLKHYKTSPGKVFLIYHGIDPEIFNNKNLTKNEKTFLSKYKINFPYVLFVSSLWYYKNLHTLLEAFSKLVKEKSIPHELLIIGEFDKSSNNYKKQIFEIIKRNSLSNRVNFLGYISNNQLRPFFKEADAYIQPSFHETFGKTVVEAFYCGCPVVSANSGSTPEITGDAGMLFDPHNSEDLFNCLLKILSDKNLANKYSKKGLQRAKSFSVDREVEEFIKVFNDLK